MKYLDEFYDREICGSLAAQIIKESTGKRWTFMEVCGTHTMSIFRNGIKGLLPENIKLVSGPGCPVCVTPNAQIDRTVEFARLDKTCVVTFGDMMKVPGSSSSLEQERAQGFDVRVVYSVSDALKIAEQNPDKRVVFLGIGFETTVPTVAASLKDAKSKNLKNYFVLSCHKLIPPAIKAILDSGEVKIDGFLLPGHVSTIIGRKTYGFIAEDYGISCAVAGFEPVDILQAILCLVKQKTPQVENCYKRAVKEDGNPVAKDLIDEVFEVSDSEWRGLGVIPDSGLRIREGFSEFDAEKNILVEITLNSQLSTLNSQCICGSILRGINTPLDCSLFGKGCTPESPVGPCMVSSEGTCAAWYKYSSQN